MEEKHCESTLHIEFSMTQTVCNQSVNMYALWYHDWNGESQKYQYDIQNEYEKNAMETTLSR